MDTRTQVSFPPIAQEWTSCEPHPQKWSFQDAAQICGVTVSDFGNPRPVVCGCKPSGHSMWMGARENRNGGSAVASILAIPAVAGKFGLRGGGYTMSNSGVWDLDKGGAAPQALSDAPEVNMNRLGATLAGSGVRALFVYNCQSLKPPYPINRAFGED